MLRATIALVWLLSTGLMPVQAQTSPAPNDNTPETPGKRADSVPSSGVIHPSPDYAARGTTINPPNVDPSITVSPPATTTDGVKINPK